LASWVELGPGSTLTAEQVQELGILQPVPPPDRTVPQHAHVHGRAAEAELDHHHQQLAERASWPR
jgi:hypothetical protein